MHDATHLTAPAKVNLGLEILRRRPDGYHELETIFYRIGLADSIELHDRQQGSTMECSDPALSTGEDNLCLRAVAAMRHATGIERGIHVVLHKRIPTGAGLGGGSSDAAAVLRGLNARWAVGLSDRHLKEIASSLGSDVPAFIGGPLSFGAGRGEILQDLPPRFPYWLVCVTPPLSVSTAWAYGHLRLLSKTEHQPLRDRFLGALPDLSALSKVLTNDFEGSVLEAQPAIAEVKRELQAAGCSLTLMSGSGSSVFGLTADRETAEATARRFGPTHVVSITPPLA
ncbi:MAG: 4-(cytidine 5'-diphospho)-2-C-methyl-D-erythritol kinase [Bacteroidetes bacterium]|jgi:4-diphosphocytidyl-2-C-methyl-D-erythritol kinase|nr:4-(cytidine 5'-diphospho)-2-C-methyl-D-erythritol kinase [Bacteroidota bacterium]